VPADEPLARLLALCEERAALPVVCLDLGQGAAGAYLRRGGHAFAFVHGLEPAVRQRFTLAHELGHHRLGHGLSIDSAAALAGRSRAPHEVQANAFAAELLAPRAAVIRWAQERAGPLRVDLELVVRLGAAFGVSAKAARVRLQTAGLLTDFSRIDRLDEEIDEGLHLELRDLLGVRGLTGDDLADASRVLPRIPDAARGSALAAYLAGTLGIDGLAAAIGRDPRTVGESLGVM
jgi:Zn-dependent peptidase ImmA (M78 family)